MTQSKSNSLSETIETPDSKIIHSPELLFTLECTKSISWKLYVDTDTIVFSDNFEAWYGIHQPDYSYKFSKFIDRHLNAHKEEIYESIDLYFSGEADVVDVGEITLFDDKNKLNWLHPRGKCINGNQKVIYGVSVDITNQKELIRMPEQKNDESGLRILMPKLSRREQEVISALLDGNVSYKDLSIALCISQNTVKTHLQHIYQTAGVSNIPALLTFLLSSAVIELS